VQDGEALAGGEAAGVEVERRAGRFVHDHLSLLERRMIG
jgi:hypothetical protein